MIHILKHLHLPQSGSGCVTIVSRNPFCSIQYHFIRDARTKFGIPNSPQSPDNGQISDGSISNFRISGQSLIVGNCHNPRTNYNIHTKLGPVTKLDKKNKITSKNWRWRHFRNLWRNCYFSSLRPILSNPEAGFWSL